MKHTAGWVRIKREGVRILLLFVLHAGPILAKVFVLNCFREGWSMLCVLAVDNTPLRQD